MDYYLMCGCLGLFSGLVFYYLAIHHVKVRSDYDNGMKLNMLKNKSNIVIWMVVSLALLFFIESRGLDYWNVVRVYLFAMLAFNVSAVDIMLRRIPNSVLLGMIVLQIAHLVVSIVNGGSVGMIKTSLIGMFIAYVIFLFPAMFKLSVGAGDVKYSAVIGFMLGFYGYIEAMAVMAVSILLFYVYLKITKTGNMKTAAPMAPFLSIGAFVALLFPMYLR